MVTLALVRTPALGRAVRWILNESPSLRTVTRAGEKQSLNTVAGRVRPQLVVISSELLAEKPRQTLDSVRRSSPDSKLLLICPCPVLTEEARKWGADACLETDVLVRRLLPTVQKLIAGPTGSAKRRPQ